MTPARTTSRWAPASQLAAVLRAPAAVAGIRVRSVAADSAGSSRRARKWFEKATPLHRPGGRSC